MAEKTIWIGKAILTVIYLVGVFGLWIPDFRAHFVILTPVTLLISAFVLFYYHEDWNKSMYMFMLIAFLAGFGLEAVGVATGMLFGDYSYSYVLGPQILDTPLIIGINWLMLIYASGTIMRDVPGPKIAKVVAGSFLMVILDFFIEPVAVDLDFWSWRAGEIPVLNYVMWFIISFGLLWVFYNFRFKKGNRIAFFFYIVQLFFFTILSFVL